MPLGGPQSGRCQPSPATTQTLALLYGVPYGIKPPGLRRPASRSCWWFVACRAGGIGGVWSMLTDRWARIHWFSADRTAQPQTVIDPHPCSVYGLARPGRTPDSTALGYRSLIRMRPEV